MLKKLNKRLKMQQGFTLIELMATLVILALIIAIAVPAIGKLVTQADKSADESSIALMERAGEMAELDGLKFDDAAPVNTELHPSITEKDVYMIPTLIEQGYLKLDDASKFNKPENYVKKVNKSGKFVYMGKGDETPPVATPGDGDGDDWVSKYRPFVTEQIMTAYESNPDNKRDSLNQLSELGDSYGEAACEEWNKIPKNTGTWEHYDCTNWYDDLFQKAYAEYETRADNGEYTPTSNSVAACFYKAWMTDQNQPVDPNISEEDMNIYMATQMQALGQEGSMAWMMTHPDCMALAMEQPPGEFADHPMKLKGLIDIVTKAMDINNDYFELHDRS